MPFDWNSFLTLADELAGRTDEAAKRTAISRAYYCVFNLAFGRAELTAGGYPGGVGYHDWCWSKYRETPDSTCKKLGIDGDRMKRRRVKADYHAYIPRLDDEVQLVLEEARQFRTELAALNPRYPLP